MCGAAVRASFAAELSPAPPLELEGREVSTERPTPAVIEETRGIGLKLGAVGYDEHGNLVGQLADVA